MNVRSQRRIAAQLLKVGKNRIWLDQSRLKDIKEAITKEDIRGLIKEKAIKVKPIKGISRFRTRKRIVQKRKGRRKGSGSRKGKQTARLSRKRSWILKVRTQREFIKELRDKKLITSLIYRNLYKKIKGSLFRSKRHIKLYIEEHKLIKK